MVEEEVDIAEEVMNDHRVIIERELRNGEATVNNWEALGERERELANIKTRLSDEIAKSKEETKRLIQAREEEVKVMEANKELVDRMEQERDRVLEELKQYEIKKYD